MQTIDWGRSVVIPAAQVEHARRMARLLHAILWAGTWLPFFFAALVLLLAAALWERRRRPVR
jgi:hypothetical protein